MKVNAYIGGKKESWIATRCKKPKFSSHRGRTWDFYEITLNGTETKGWIDTSWGRFVFFEFLGKWYKVDFEIFPDIRDFTVEGDCFETGE
jgi:hypothetical protein